MKSILALSTIALLALPVAAQTAPESTEQSMETNGMREAKQAGESARFNLDTPIVVLLADKRTKAVIDKHLPGLSTDENLDKFKTMSLRRFQPMTGGQLTDEMMAEVEADLAAVQDGGPVVR